METARSVKAAGSTNGTLSSTNAPAADAKANEDNEDNEEEDDEKGEASRSLQGAEGLCLCVGFVAVSSAKVSVSMRERGHVVFLARNAGQARVLFDHNPTRVIECEIEKLVVGVEQKFPV